MSGGGQTNLSTPLAIEAEIQKIGSPEGRRVSCLQEQGYSNSDYFYESEENPSTYGRGKEFQHDKGVLEIQGEGANYNQRLLSQSKLVKILLTCLPTNLLTPIKNLVPYYPSALVSSKKAAFTLAEVLITLGIIGVVAAMTLPTIIQKNNNRVVETRLQKFYSNINQAVQMAEVDYGDRKTWAAYYSGGGVGDADKNAEIANSIEQWFNKYFKPYLKITGTEKASNGYYFVYFPDGSALALSSFASVDWTFYPGNPKKCIKKYGYYNTGAGGGVCFFLFQYNPDSTSVYLRNKGVEPYKAGWNGDSATLLSGQSYSCNTNHRGYCTALIQANGWKIPDNYPFKVSY